MNEENALARKQITGQMKSAHHGQNLTISNDPKHDRPLISIITPCLDSIKTITATLTSVSAVEKLLILKGWSLEHVLIDGGSSDGTTEIVHKYVNENNLRQCIHPVSGGPYAAMNAGLEKVNGIYTHVLNSDDYIMDPEKYTEMLELGWQQKALVLISSICYYKRGNNSACRQWTVKPIANTSDTWRRMLLRGLHYPHPGFIAETGMYQDESFDVRYNISADYKLMQNILLKPHVAGRVVTNPLALVAMAEGGASWKWQGILKGFKQIHAINKELGIRAPAWERYLKKLGIRLRPCSYRNPKKGGTE